MALVVGTDTFGTLTALKRMVPQIRARIGTGTHYEESDAESVLTKYFHELCSYLRNHGYTSPSAIAADSAALAWCANCQLEGAVAEVLRTLSTGGMGGEPAQADGHARRYRELLRDLRDGNVDLGSLTSDRDQTAHLTADLLDEDDSDYTPPITMNGSEW